MWLALIVVVEWVTQKDKLGFTSKEFTQKSEKSFLVCKLKRVNVWFLAWATNYIVIPKKTNVIHTIICP